MFEEGDEKAVRGLDRAWNEAYVQRDVAALARVLADDWLGLTPQHEIVTKEMLLESQRQAPSDVEVSFYDGTLHDFGNTAVTTGRTTVKGPGVFVDQRFTRVYAKRQGQWRAVAVQVVPITTA